MAQQTIGIGASANDGTGDTLRVAFDKANDNFDELYASLAGLSGTYQPLDSDLTAIAALTTTTFGRSLLTQASASALRTAAGLVIGTDVQAYSSVLQATTASFLTAQETKLGHITVTQAVDLDAIETRVNALDAAVVLKGTWDASAGTFPGSGTAQAGDSYIVSVGGTVGGVAFVANDRILAITDNASTSTYAANWHKLDYTDAVLSVAGRTGAVTLALADLTDASANGRSLVGAVDYSAMRTLLSLVVGTNVQAWSAALDTWAGKTAPSGTVVGTTDTQTLSGKTLTGTKETVFTITDGAAFEIDPANGGIQVITLGANRTPAATNFTAGQSVTLMIADGTAYTITWSTVGVTWVGGSAPTLATSGYTVVELWKVGSTIYGARVGDVA